MTKRKLAYLFGAVSVTSAGAFAVGYGLKNKSLNRWFLEDEKKISQGIQTISPDNHTSQAIIKARDLVLRYKDEIGAPGMVIGVSVNGINVWSEGVGMADVENRVPCHSDTVMRIASISKSMTMAVVAKLWEEGKIDFDKPIQEYVPHFPVKTFEEKEVEITTRLLASHLAGIRHYSKKGEKKRNDDSDLSDTGFKEFYLMDKFDNVDQALKLFQDDELMSKPGTSYHYTTHGWTLISAVVEGAAKKPFPKLMTSFFKSMGMKNTYLDENDLIIYNRSRYYARNKRGRLTNVPYADNSYKWAGGGFVSTVGDLLQFCNAMLLSYQQHDDKSTHTGYLQPQTVHTLWTPHPVTQSGGASWGRDGGYGMGWVVVPQRSEFSGGDKQLFSVGHSGGAVGASSVILVVPHHGGSTAPSGVAVAIITNLQDVGLHRLAADVAKLFAADHV